MVLSQYVFILIVKNALNKNGSHKRKILKELNFKRKQFKEDLWDVLIQTVSIKSLIGKLYNFQESIDSIRKSMKYCQTKRLKNWSKRLRKPSQKKKL